MTLRIHSWAMAMQLTCHPSPYAVQPFLIETVLASSGGSPSMMPQRPPCRVTLIWSATPPLTWVIVSRSHGVHFGPAAVPFATQSPYLTASCGLIWVFAHQYGKILVWVSPHIEIIRCLTGLEPPSSQHF